MSLPPLQPGSLGFGMGGPRHSERFQAHWKAIVAFGLLSAVLGIAALVLSVTATIATVLLIGIFMSLAGIVQLAIGFRTRSWGRFIAFEIAGLVYLVAGVFAIFSPLEASIVLTLLLGAGLIATAASRLFLAFQMSGSPRRGGAAAGRLRDRLARPSRRHRLAQQQSLHPRHAPRRRPAVPGCRLDGVRVAHPTNRLTARRGRARASVKKRRGRVR